MANKLDRTLSTRPGYAIVAVLPTVGGAGRMVSRRHDELFFGVVSRFSGLFNAINAARAYRRRATESGRSVGA